MWSLGLDDVKSRVLDDLEKRVNRGRGASVSPRDRIDHIESGEEENCNKTEQWSAFTKLRDLNLMGCCCFPLQCSPVLVEHFPFKLNVVEDLGRKEFYLLKQ